MTHNTDPSALWDSLITSATLGTDRRACAPPAVPGPLGALLAGLDLSDAEGALLGGAAACALAMRAGRLPPAVPEGEEIPPCPEEDLPECSPAARQHLALMLQGHHRAALPEWLAALVARGMRAPAAHLPDLLDLGRVQEELRPRILATLGARGRWLASLNPAWDYASAELKMLRAEHSGTTRSTQHAARSTWETSP
ncbi:MAG TPA: DUF5691 domain-containing protein, partial [Roseiflexaceae bacterium]|nr:DUF5691 domain-containing protein [Roseiflexaceae bacterium]